MLVEYIVQVVNRTVFIVWLSFVWTDTCANNCLIQRQVLQELWNLVIPSIRVSKRHQVVQKQQRACVSFFWTFTPSPHVQGHSTHLLTHGSSSTGQGRQEEAPYPPDVLGLAPCRHISSPHQQLTAGSSISPTGQPQDEAAARSSPSSAADPQELDKPDLPSGTLPGVHEGDEALGNPSATTAKALQQSAVLVPPASTCLLGHATSEVGVKVPLSTGNLHQLWGC